MRNGSAISILRKEFSMNRRSLFAALGAALPVRLLAGSKALGAKLTLKSPTPIADLLANPDKFAGKTVQVRGRITEVCQKAGCWMNLVDDATGKSIRIKVKDGEIVFPKESSGKQATAEGVFTKIEMSKEQAIAQAKHEAEEQGRTFDPSSVKSGKVTFQIQGAGAVVEGL